MTTNIAQETTSLAPATQSFHPFSIHLINSERVFLLAVFCEYELLLRKAASVLGYPDLAFRADIVKGLFDQVCAKPGTVRDGELNIETEDEESEFHIALDGACDLVDTYSSYDYDVACQLCTAILNKLSAAPVGYDDDDCDYDILGEPAEPDASSSVQTVQQALPFSDSDFAEPVEPDPAPELSAGDVPVDPPPAEAAPAAAPHLVAEGCRDLVMCRFDKGKIISAEPASAPAESAPSLESVFTDDECEYLFERFHGGIAEAERSSLCKAPDREKAVFLRELARSLMGPGTLSMEQREYLLNDLRSSYNACKNVAMTFLEVYERTEHDREGVWDNLRLMDLCLSLIGKLEKQYQTEEV